MTFLYVYGCLVALSTAGFLSVIAPYVRAALRDRRIERGLAARKVEIDGLESAWRMAYDPERF